MAGSLVLPKFEPDRDRLVWYLAYGSNLSSQTFREDRQITPQAAVAVVVPGWRLTLSSAGFPYREPSFASIAAVGSAGPTDEKHDGPCELPLHGTAYLITWSQWIKIIASEGGGIAYEEALLRGRPIQPQDQQRWGAELSVLTLVSTMERWPESRPSKRYMSLILDGARAAGFPANYIAQIRHKHPCYQPPATTWARIGVTLFLGFWTPVLTLLSLLTHAAARAGPGDDGHVPEGVRALVRFAMFTMWWIHDLIWSRIWGRGDGLFPGGMQLNG